MICKVRYYKVGADGKGFYAGRDYTYKTNMELKPYEKVLVPVSNSDELKKALVTEINLPDSVIDPAWADQVKFITEYDEETPDKKE